jgi:hypothetical protein
MAKIGVEAKINLMDSTAVVDRVLVKHDFEMVVSNWGALVDINMRSVSFFKGQRSDYMGIDDPKLEDMVHQWRRTIEPEKRKAISADMQRLIAEQLYWVNTSGYPFFQAHTNKVKGYPFYNRAIQFSIWYKWRAWIFLSPLDKRGAGVDFSRPGVRQIPPRPPLPKGGMNPLCRKLNDPGKHSKVLTNSAFFPTTNTPLNIGSWYLGH